MKLTHMPAAFSSRVPDVGVFEFVEGGRTRMPISRYLSAQLKPSKTKSTPTTQSKKPKVEVIVEIPDRKTTKAMANGQATEFPSQRASSAAIEEVITNSQDVQVDSQEVSPCSGDLTDDQIYKSFGKVTGQELYDLRFYYPDLPTYSDEEEDRQPVVVNAFFALRCLARNAPKYRHYMLKVGEDTGGYEGVLAQARRALCYEATEVYNASYSEGQEDFDGVLAEFQKYIENDALTSPDDIDIDFINACSATNPTSLLYVMRVQREMTKWLEDNNTPHKSNVTNYLNHVHRFDHGRSKMHFPSKNSLSGIRSLMGFHGSTIWQLGTSACSGCRAKIKNGDCSDLMVPRARAKGDSVLLGGLLLPCGQGVPLKSDKTQRELLRVDGPCFSCKSHGKTNGCSLAANAPRFAPSDFVLVVKDCVQISKVMNDQEREMMIRPWFENLKANTKTENLFDDDFIDKTMEEAEEKAEAARDAGALPDLLLRPHDGDSDGGGDEGGEPDEDDNTFEGPRSGAKRTAGRQRYDRNAKKTRV